MSKLSELSPASIIYYTRFGFAVAAGVLSGFLKAFDWLGLGLAFLLYAATYGFIRYGLKVDTTRLNKPSGIFTIGLYTYLTTWLVTWVVVYNLVYVPYPFMPPSNSTGLL